MATRTSCFLGTPGASWLPRGQPPGGKGQAPAAKREQHLALCAPVPHPESAATLLAASSLAASRERSFARPSSAPASSKSRDTARRASAASPQLRGAASARRCSSACQKSSGLAVPATAARAAARTSSVISSWGSPLSLLNSRCCSATRALASFAARAKSSAFWRASTAAWSMRSREAARATRPTRPPRPFPSLLPPSVPLSLPLPLPLPVPLPPSVRTHRASSCFPRTCSTRSLASSTARSNASPLVLEMTNLMGPSSSGTPGLPAPRPTSETRTPVCSTMWRRFSPRSPRRQARREKPGSTSRSSSTTSVATRGRSAVRPPLEAPRSARQAPLAGPRQHDMAQQSGPKRRTAAPPTLPLPTPGPNPRCAGAEASDVQSVLRSEAVSCNGRFQEGPSAGDAASVAQLRPPPAALVRRSPGDPSAAAMASGALCKMLPHDK
mmetsp:Transcript_126297/g.351896  ORF Transcript_126297/g.351896 Transcript_126297/m.351896 type:complete len:441 (-) Transcript_126297:6-1328(-)